MTLLAALKTILDGVAGAPEYFYSEIPETLTYPFLDIENHREVGEQDTLNSKDGNCSVVNGTFDIVIHCESPLSVGETKMGLIVTALTPTVFDSVLLVAAGSTCLFPLEYSTKQVGRSKNNQPLHKITKKYRLEFGGSN